MSDSKNLEGCSRKYKTGSIVKGFTITDIRRSNNRIEYKCKCEYCKKEKWFRDISNLKECECSRFREYVGTTISNFKLKELVREGNKLKFKCICNLCNGSAILSLHSIKLGRNISCGCLVKDRFKSNLEANYVEGTNLGQLKSEKPKKASKTGVRGVSQRKNGKFLAQITFQGKNHNLGTWDTIEEAKEAYEKGREYYFKPILDKYKDK